MTEHRTGGALGNQCPFSSLEGFQSVSPSCSLAVMSETIESIVIITKGGPARHLRHLVHCTTCDCVFACKYLCRNDVVKCPTCGARHIECETFAVATLRSGLPPHVDYKAGGGMFGGHDTTEMWAHLAPQITAALSTIAVPATVRG